MKVICISGKARHGKDTVAELMTHIFHGDGRRVKVLHYADLLKFMCKQLFDWDGEKDEHGRTLLQYVGTDVVRHKQPNFWVDFVIQELKLFGDHWDYVIIPDCRFPNELERLREEGFDVTHYRVERFGFRNLLSLEQSKHPSETAMDGVHPDCLLLNGGTIADLFKNVVFGVRQLRIEMEGDDVFGGVYQKA